MARDGEMVKRRKGGKLEFVWNGEKGEFLGRTGGSWARVGIFYVIFYACLSGFFAACMAGFFTTVDSKIPSRHGKDSILKDYPGMGYQPRPDVGSTLINFTSEDNNETYKGYLDTLVTFLKSYDNQTGDNMKNCTDDGAHDKKICIFDTKAELGNNCTVENSFGYSTGMPCVLLKLNKIYGWKPNTFSKENGTNNIPDNQKEKFQDGNVFVTCEGENPADVDNIGLVQMWPPQGIAAKYFPFLNQPGYRAPVVMVQFQNPTPGVLIQIWCKAWANNIYHHKNDKAGSVHFELFMDTKKI